MPIDVVLLEPCFPANQREFARALHAVGARVTGIGERPKEALDPALRGWLAHYEQIGNVTDEAHAEARRGVHHQRRRRARGRRQPGGRRRAGGSSPRRGATEDRPHRAQLTLEASSTSLAAMTL